jgi:hypothetical protein
MLWRHVVKKENRWKSKKIIFWKMTSCSQGRFGGTSLSSGSKNELNKIQAWKEMAPAFTYFSNLKMGRSAPPKYRLAFNGLQGISQKVLFFIPSPWEREILWMEIAPICVRLMASFDVSRFEDSVSATTSTILQNSLWKFAFRFWVTLICQRGLNQLNTSRILSSPRRN